MESKTFDQNSPGDVTLVMKFLVMEIRQTSPADPLRAMMVSELGLLYRDRYILTKVATDMNEAVYYGRQALKNIPDKLDFTRPALLINLAMLLVEKSSRVAGADHLEEAFDLHKEATLVSRRHEDREGTIQGGGAFFGRRTLAFLSRYMQIQQASERASELDKVIEIGRYIIANGPRDHPGRSAWLNDLGFALVQRHNKTGNTADLEEGIKAHREALASKLEDHPDKASWMTDLAAALRSLYKRMNEMKNLEEAIDVQEQALAMESVTDYRKAAFLYKLSRWTMDKYHRTKSMADLRKGIAAARKAVNLTLVVDPERSIRRSHLADSLTLQFSQTQAMGDLEKAIAIHRRVVKNESRSGSTVNVDIHLSSLASSLRELYSATKATAHLDEAIKHLRQAIDMTTGDDSFRIEFLHNLGLALDTRSSAVGAMADREEALAWHLAALHHPHSSGTHKMLAGIPIVAMSPDPQQAYEVAKAVLDLVPALVFKSLDAYDQNYASGPIVGLASDAAAAALRVGEPPMAALTLLEKGRSTIAASIDNGPAGFGNLEDRHPGQAEQFVKLRKQLTPLHNKVPASKLERLFNEIRTFPGFEDFPLPPPKEAEICDAARHGPIVVINVSRFRCDAFLIQSRQIRVLPLTDLSRDDIARRQGLYQLGARENLEWLWDTIARPVLDALQLTCPHTKGDWPHVWWIPTGILAKFPIHAAGYHGIGSHNTVMDRVMSSYACSIESILKVRFRSTTPRSGAGVVVAMGDTPDYGPLPHAAQDAAELITAFHELSLRPVQPERNRQAILAQVKGCHVFHFSGHVHAGHDPAHSELLVGDWKEGPLTVAHLYQACRQGGKSPFLAYLSASGQASHDNDPYEGVNMMSACQVAGFRHVVGALWEVNDRIRLDVAREIYRVMKAEGMTDAAVCLGYHTATRQLRDRWLRGEETVDVRDDGGPSAGRQDASHAGVPADAEKMKDWVWVDSKGWRGEAVQGPSWASFVHFGA
ncbi:unnamed protein product [Clonostachys rosea]|uniref:CHAT domain-containing protein n=1 Tax=Bionectria ochroleuca TaxID=29856 RepID=A0ABY6UKW1_BIOOC|nr:unnamed protein product [Clonostachys rosea]